MEFSKTIAFFRKITMKYLISIAPMMGYTNSHARYFLRLLSKHSLLYTEMITSSALIQGRRYDLLTFDELEHPIALQLGGNNPKEIATCALLGANEGFDEINLNIGCPSAKVKTGAFGACLMNDPDLVASMVSAIKAVTDIPVSIKCRIGVDQNDSYEFLANFISINAKAGCEKFIIHARKALLSGLSPKENRTIPCLDYEMVKKIKASFAKLNIVINGGFKEINNIKQYLSYLDGVMIGREVFTNPSILLQLEKEIFANEENISKSMLVKNFMPYVEKQLAKNIKLSTLIKPMLGLFYHKPHGKRWRHFLSNPLNHKLGANILIEALNYV